MIVTFPPCPPAIASSLRVEGARPIVSLFADMQGLGLNVHGGAIESGDAHLVFHIEPRVLLRSRSLEAARPAAWRMSHTVGGIPFAAEVDIIADPDNDIVTTINRGPFAGVPTRQLAGLRASATEGTFVLRLLRIPEIKLMAIWLYSPRGELLIPIAPAPHSLVEEREYLIPQAVELLAPLIERLERLPHDEDQ